jgi:hypothetical protein
MEEKKTWLGLLLLIIRNTSTSKLPGMTSLVVQH